MLGKMKRILIGKPMKSAELMQKNWEMEGARHLVLRCFIIRGLRYGTDFACAGCGRIRRAVVLGSDFNRRAGIARHFNFSYRQTIFAYPTGAARTS